MKYRSSRQSKAKSFDKKTRENIAVRDGGCIFCQTQRWQGGDVFEQSIFDIVISSTAVREDLGLKPTVSADAGTITVCSIMAAKDTGRKCLPMQKAI